MIRFGDPSIITSYDKLLVKKVKKIYMHQNWTKIQEKIDEFSQIEVSKEFKNKCHSLTRANPQVPDFDLALLEIETDFPEWSKTLKPACLDVEREQLLIWEGLLDVSFEGAVSSFKFLTNQNLTSKKL